MPRPPFYEEPTRLDPATKNRVRRYVEFFDHIEGPILDVGDPGVVKAELEKVVGSIESTLPCDFNDEVHTSRSRYGTIFCFEVLEHVMNPLRFLEDLGSLLNLGSGRLYLSTPLERFGFYCTKNHFVEYKRRQLETLLRCAGLHIRRRTEFRLIPYPTGLRTLVGMPFHRIQLYECSYAD